MSNDNELNYTQDELARARQIMQAEGAKILQENGKKFKAKVNGAINEKVGFFASTLTEGQLKLLEPDENEPKFIDPRKDNKILG